MISSVDLPRRSLQPRCRNRSCVDQQHASRPAAGRIRASAVVKLGDLWPTSRPGGRGSKAKIFSYASDAPLSKQERHANAAEYSVDLGVLTGCLILANAIASGCSPITANPPQLSTSTANSIMVGIAVSGCDGTRRSDGADNGLRVVLFLALREFPTASSVESADRPRFASFLIALPVQYALLLIGLQSPRSSCSFRSALC